MDSSPIRCARLDISNPEASLEFYTQRLGMRLLGVDRESVEGASFYSLSFETGAALRLCHRTDSECAAARYLPRDIDAYWKIGITIADVDIACARLRENGVEVTAPFQFHNIGYLCHLEDPDGYCIELLQHRFEKNHRPASPVETEALGNKPNLGQVSLNVSSIEQSLAFYRDRLGWKVLSRQEVPDRGFSLWFLGRPDARPPAESVDAIENREWLWSQPETTLELRAWDQEVSPLRAHPPGNELGFRGLEIVSPGSEGMVRDPEGVELFCV